MSPGLSLAHYRITSKLGEGGMGVVWRASDTKLNREVAIKVLPESVAGDPDRMARFGREAQVLASLNHPNIAAIYGVEERALVMELVDGPTLAERIAEGPVTLDEALKVARQIADALAAAHDKGVVHRDLKPANIKLAADGRVKVLDFGLAKAMSADAASNDPVHSPTLTMRATVAGVILGTAGYMAPEQARGKAVDQRADIWAFGVVLYEMLTGEMLFSGETVSDTLAAVLTKNVDLQRVPASVRKLLASCLERNPRERLRDIGDAWRLIEEPAAFPAAAPAGRRHTAPWIVAAALGLAAAALAFLHFREGPAPAAARFHISPPDRGAFAEWLSLSPDGRQLAFTGTGADGALRVFIRSLDNLEPRPATTADLSQTVTLFWSPDSRHLVYQLGSKIKRLDVQGGPPQTLCDAPPVMLGGSWNADGVILFGSNSGPVMRVSASGGHAEAVTRLEASRHEVLHTDPTFLPDGVHFLYVRRSADPQNDGVFVGSLKAKPEEQNLQRVVATGFSAGYAPPRGSEPGYLLYMREGTLVAQQFDAGRLQLSGEAMPVAEQVATSITRAVFSVTPDKLVYRTGGGALLHLSWYDREGRALGRVAEGADFRGVAISPDGSRVAYDRVTENSARQVWVVDTARGIHTRLTFMPQGGWSPVWSPDGRSVAFAAMRQGSLYVKDVNDGSDARQVFDPHVGMSVMSSWSPDGRFLLFTEAAKSYDLLALPTAPGGERKALPVADSEAGEAHGQISPDSRWVAYDSNESGRSEIYVRPFPPGDGRTGKSQVSFQGGQQPRWRGDGKELYYLSPERSIMSVDVRTQPSFESATPRALFNSPAITLTTLQFQYDVTRDGKKFLIAAPMPDRSSAPVTIVENWTAGLKK